MKEISGLHPASDFTEVGEKFRRLINGDAQVDDHLETRNGFNDEWQLFATNQLWSRTWARNILQHQQLSLINLGMLAGAARMEEWEIHFRVALKVTKIPLVQLRETILHIGMYCGVPIGRDCMAITRRVLTELNIDLSELDNEVPA